MSTSGLIIVRDDDNRPLVAIHQHGDGYPSGLGHDLAKTFGETKMKTLLVQSEPFCLDEEYTWQ
jgi:hypothetical protein